MRFPTLASTWGAREGSPKAADKALSSQAADKLQEKPTKGMVWRSKMNYLNREKGKFAPGLDLQLLPSFLHRVRDADTDSSVDLWLQGELSYYHGWFMVVGCNVRAFFSGRLRPVFTADAAHCRGVEKGMLFGFHAFGPEDELITLAVAHSLGEDEATWAWFFRNVCASLPGLCDMDCHLITDGEKGLSNAVRDVLPKAYHAECAFHRSLKLSHHTTTRPLFLKMACAYTLDDYKILRERLEQFATPESIATIDAVPPNLFCLAHMPSTEEEAERHWYDCANNACQFSSQHYDSGVQFDLDYLKGSLLEATFLLPLEEQRAKAQRVLLPRWIRTPLEMPLLFNLL